MFSFVVPSVAGAAFFWRRWAGTTLAVLSSAFESSRKGLGMAGKERARGSKSPRPSRWRARVHLYRAPGRRARGGALTHTGLC